MSPRSDIFGEREREGDRGREETYMYRCARSVVALGTISGKIRGGCTIYRLTCVRSCACLRARQRARSGGCNLSKSRRAAAPNRKIGLAGRRKAYVKFATVNSISAGKLLNGFRCPGLFARAETPRRRPLAGHEWIHWNFNPETG